MGLDFSSKYSSIILPTSTSTNGSSTLAVAEEEKPIRITYADENNREKKEKDSFLLNSHKTKRSQSALEYMMTYGWAILIIVIVAVILYSMGIFNPSSSITFTSWKRTYSTSKEKLLSATCFIVFSSFTAFLTISALFS